jgi:hypothetical protein
VDANKIKLNIRITPVAIIYQILRSLQEKLLRSINHYSMRHNIPIHVRK